MACLLSSCHLPWVVAIDNAPFNFNPLEKSSSFSNFLYNSREYFLILVIPAEGPNWLTSPAACQVVPEVSWSLSRSIVSFQPYFAK